MFSLKFLFSNTLLKSFNILVIESETDTKLKTISYLKNNSFEVDTADTGKNGIIKAYTGKFDFIIIDIMTPNRDGLTALSHLKYMPETKSIPIGVYTSIPESLVLNDNPQANKNWEFYWQKNIVNISTISKQIRGFLELSSGV